jgi:hypothetical protein
VRFRLGVPKRRWVRLLLLFGGIPAVLGLMAVVYFWVSYGRMIDARLGDGEQRPIPRLFARPFELQPGRALAASRLVPGPNGRGHAERPKVCVVPVLSRKARRTVPTSATAPIMAISASLPPSRHNGFGCD